MRFRFSRYNSRCKRRNARRPPAVLLHCRRHGAPVHLHDAEPPAGSPAQQGGPEGDLPVVLPGREDRRPRLERRREVDAAADHGGRRQGLLRRRQARRRHPHRLPAPGTGAGSAEERARKRRGGGGGDQAAAHPVRRGQPEAGRGPEARRDGEAARRAGQAAGRDRGGQRLGSRSHAGDRDGRAPAPARRRRRHEAVGRRAAPRGALPDPARTPRHAAARRADQPPRRRERRLARAPPARVPGNDRRGDARSLLPRQRRGLDPGAGSRRRDPLGGQLFVVARAEAEAARGRREGRVGAAAHAGARARMGARLAARAPGEVEGASRRLRTAAGGGEREAGGARSRSASRPGRAWETSWSRPTS